MNLSLYNLMFTEERILSGLSSSARRSPHGQHNQPHIVHGTVKGMQIGAQQIHWRYCILFIFEVGQEVWLKVNMYKAPMKSVPALKIFLINTA
mmetsp:Transcript_5932/g.8148  ORF Transcript_5932/g.8148 Transcript_5932/m.8148 type:complete len:93 (+) Transcript_5932:462-740(+)